MSGLIYPEESYKSARKSLPRSFFRGRRDAKNTQRFFFAILCAFASLREIFAFWDLNFHFMPKSLCSNVSPIETFGDKFIEYDRKLLVSY